jgi:hypothetical protein
MPAIVRFYPFGLAGETRPQLSHPIPRSPGIIPAVIAAGFSCRRTATAEKTRYEDFLESMGSITSSYPKVRIVW